MSKDAMRVKRKAVALHNALVSKPVTTNAPASSRVQRLARELVALAGEWHFPNVPQPVWYAVVRSIRDETKQKRELGWWWCGEIARQLLWLMDVDYMIEGVPSVAVGKVGKHSRAKTVVRCRGAKPRHFELSGNNQQALKNLAKKGKHDFGHGQYLQRFIDELPELHPHIERVKNNLFTLPQHVRDRIVLPDN